MSARLDQVLAYLDRDDVTEILLGVGHPVTLTKGGEHVPITKVPVTQSQLDLVVAGTPLVPLIPDFDDATPALLVTIGARKLSVRVGRRGDEVVFRIARAPAARSRGASIQPRTKPASAAPAPRFKPSTILPRTKPATASPVARTKAATNPAATHPRTKTGTSPAATQPKRGKGTTIAPRSKGTTSMPRSKAKSLAVNFTTRRPELLDLVRQAHDKGASDLHIASGRATMVRIVGELIPLDRAPVAAADVEELLEPLLAPHRTRFDATGYIDFAIASPVAGRLRANVSRYQGGLRATFRIARESPPTLEEIGLPRELGKVIAHHQGLVVIAGPSGHGKTTTLAALVELINASKPFHIITVEDPVEIVFPRKAAVVSQREVGSHTKSFASALKGSLREDPDVIVIGELRDRETVEIALTAAETGHLVLATMSTPSAAKTIDRLIDMFPPDDQSQVRASIAGALRAIVAQRLVPSSDGTELVPVVELLTGCFPLSAMIRDDKLYQLPNLMQRGRSFGMIRLDDSLVELVRTGRITSEAAIGATESKKELAALLKGHATTQVIGTLPAAKPGASGGLFGGKKRE